MAKLLLVDDDIELVELLAELLRLEGFQVEIAHNGQQALEKLNSSYDLVLLDIMMPVLNGVETLKQLRQRFDTPVMMLTARGNEIDRVLGLELGADDYLSKPFNDRELVARIKSILRRTVKNSAEIPKSNVKDSGMIEYAGITLQTGSQQAFFAGQNLYLTGTEFALLQILITHRGQILSREYLNMKVLNKTLTPFDRAIDMHMSNLRKKLPPKADGSPWFKTLRGRGYLFISEQH
ncbi:MAG: response regulator [[Pasteurella] mairii]|uniref:Transcriptional regulatory protein CpxR n=1 Tax=[Pasteurella] mairii TaxID=757 RepID=A0A379B2G9_9PAST|nr:response regulator [[Pasteurella] mairii]SUB32642.1 transcriptional regulatory protein CpxR [[Pasteurella] mairii]